MASSSDASASDNGIHLDGVTYYHKKFKIRSSLSVPNDGDSCTPPRACEDSPQLPEIAPTPPASVQRPISRGEAPTSEPAPPQGAEEHALKAAAAARKAGKYRCNFCGNYFAKPSVLDKHIRSHTNERPFSCAVCKYSFKTKSNFVKHCKTRKHAARSAGGDGGDLPSDEEVSDSDASDAGEDGASESDGHVAWDLAASSVRSWTAEDLSRPAPSDAGSDLSSGAARSQLSHSIDNIIGGVTEAAAASPPSERPGSPIAKGVVNHIDKVIQLNEAQLSWTKRALDNFGRHSTTLGRERETVRRVASTDPNGGRRSSLYLPRPAPELAVPALARRSSVIGVEAQHELPAPPSELPARPGPPSLMRSSLSFPGPDELPLPVAPESLVFTAMPSLLEARCVGCGLTHPGPCPLYTEGGQQGHILKRHLLQSTAAPGAPQIKRRRLSSETERLAAARGAFEPVVPAAAAAAPASGMRSPFEERKNLSYMAGGQVVVNDPNDRRTYRVHQSVSSSSTSVGFYVTSPPACQASSRETSPQVMTIKSNLNSGGKMIEMSGSSDSSSGGSQLGTARLSGGSSAPPLQRNPFQFNQPSISNMFTGSFYPTIQAPNITPQLGPIMLPPSPNKTTPSAGRPSSASKRFCSPRSPSTSGATPSLTVPPLMQPSPVVAVPTLRGTPPGGKSLKKLTIKIPSHTFAGAASAGPSFPSLGLSQTAATMATGVVMTSAPAPSPVSLQPPVSAAPRRSPSRHLAAHVPHVPGMPGPYSQASDVTPRLPAGDCPPPAATSRPPPKIQVQKVATPPPPPPAEGKPSKPGGSLPRPSTLPLQPVQYNNKSQRGAALYSPETPRPRKAIQQQHMNGKCYTYITHKSSTKLYFCSVFQPQPNHVEQKSDRQVSMYSQWKHIEPPSDGVPVTEALGSLRLAVNRGSGGRLTFQSPDMGPASPRVAPAGLRLPRLAGVKEQENQAPVSDPAAELRLRPDPPTCQCPAAVTPHPCPDGACPAAAERSDQGQAGSVRLPGNTQRRLTAELPARSVKNGRPANWPGGWEPDDRGSSARDRPSRNTSGTAEEMEAAEALVTFGGVQPPQMQDAPIDLSVSRAPPPPRLPAAASVLAPPSPQQQMALMYAALSRLQRVTAPPPTLPSSGHAGQRYTVELQLSARQRRLSADPPPVKREPQPTPPPEATPPAPPAASPAPTATSERGGPVNLPVMSPPSQAAAALVAAPTAADTYMSDEEIDVVTSQERAPAEFPAPRRATPPAASEARISPPPPVSAGSDAAAADADTPAPASGSGVAAILKDIFNQVRHERASAGFAPSRSEPASGAAAGAGAGAEPPASAPSLMHPNVTAGQPGLALTRPVARPAGDGETQRSDSSFFNRNSDRLVCSVCNKRDFVNRNQLSAHVKTHQMDQRRFRCEVCEVSFRSEQQLNKHRKSNDHLQKASIHRQFGKPQGDRRIYECLFCMRGFHNIGTLHKHFRCKTHIMGLENAGWLPCGTYAELEALGVPGHTDGADSINVEGTWPNYCHLQELSLTLLRDRPAEMSDWRRKFEEIRRGRPPRSYPFEIDPKLRGNADPSRPRPQFPADFCARLPPENGANESTKSGGSPQPCRAGAGAAGLVGGNPHCAPLKQEQEEEEAVITHRLNGQTY